MPRSNLAVSRFPDAEPPLALVAAPARRSLRTRLIAAVHEWRRRVRSRRELTAMSQLGLKDLGYPAGTEVEKFKPFWRA